MLSALETIALSKAVKDTAAKDARVNLAEGHHDVDFTVRVHGPLLVAPPAPTVLKEKVPEVTILGLVLETLTPAARKKVQSYLDEQLAEWRQGEDDVPLQPSAAEAAERLLSFGRRERAATRNGNVTAPLTVELLARAVAA